MASNSYKQLQILITMLDDSRNDIYLLEDKKSNLLGHKFHVNYSNINYLRPINIYWGNYSQIGSELKLLKAAIFNNYNYYHLMSDQDLPLHNQDYIHKFFNCYSGYEFIQYQFETRKEINDKLNPHLFINYFDSGIHSEHGNNNILIKVLLSIYRRFEHKITSNIKETKIPYNKVSMGSQWVSIDNKLAHLIVHYSNWIFDKFHRGKTVDELFIPTLLNYFPNIYNKVYDKKQYCGCNNNPLSNLRFIKKDVQSAHPKIWTINDYNTLIRASKEGYLFSRKFDLNKDNKVINKIFAYTMK